jgi:two-component system response regulator
METSEILYVEDNPNDIELTLRALKKRNLVNSIKIIQDGEEALEYIFCTGQYAERDKRQNPKIILLDLKLPKVSGLEILEQLKSNEQTKKIPVVVLTSSGEEVDMAKSYNYGANAYVVKPINFENFSDAVSTLGLFWLIINKSL